MRATADEADLVVWLDQAAQVVGCFDDAAPEEEEELELELEEDDEVDEATMAAADGAFVVDLDC